MNKIISHEFGNILDEMDKILEKQLIKINTRRTRMGCLASDLPFSLFV